MVDLDQEKRNAKLYQAYWSGKKAKMLGIEYGLTEVQVHRIWKAMRAKDPNLEKQPCKCGGERRGTAHYCAKCLAAMQRAKRERMTPEQRQKERCRSYTHLLVKRGKLRKQPCGVCSKYPSEAHHPDYNRPDLVQWLCRYHHMEEETKKSSHHGFPRISSVEHL